MRTSKFTVEQIAHTLRRVESGAAVADVCRELGITETTFYRWNRKLWIYSYDIVKPGHPGVEEVHVNAKTGESLLTESSTLEPRTSVRGQEPIGGHPGVCSRPGS
jgi:putative transposase